MKTNKTIITILSIVLFLTACQSQQVSPEKQAILQEIEEKVEEYNAFLEEEKAKGQYVEVKLPDGSEGIEFTGRSGLRVFEKLEETANSIVVLNEYYFSYSVQENPAISYPNPSGKSQAELEKEGALWWERVRKNGDTVILLAGNGTKVLIPIGESYVELKQNILAYPIPMVDRVIPPTFVFPENYSVNSGIEFQTIQKVEGRFTQVSYVRSGGFSNPDLPEFERVVYDTSVQKNYTFDEVTHEVIAIYAFIIPQDSAGHSRQELESQARNFIKLISPGLNIVNLIPEYQRKVTTHIFRWSDPGKRLADGSMPYIQVELTSKGELMSYINLIPLAK